MKSAFFRGRRFTFTPKAYGWVDEKGQEIHVDDALRGYSHLFVAVHEALHACFPEKSESEIEKRGRDLARFLWRLKCRRVK